MARATLLLLMAVLGAARAARADGPPIVIGAVLTLSGEDAARGRAVLAGYRAAIGHLDAAGGIQVVGDMRRLVLQVFDDHGSVARAAALARVLIERRGAVLLLGDVRPALTEAVAAAAAPDYIPVVDIDGIAEASGGGAIVSVVPRLADQLAPALAGISLAYRMAGRQPGDVGSAVIAGDEITAGRVKQALAAWSFRLAAPRDADLTVLALPSAAQARLPLAPVVLALGCGSAAGLRRRRPDAVLLCVDPWPRLAAGAAVPAWLAAAAGGGRPDDATMSAAVALLALARTVEMSGTTYGLAAADSLRKIRFDSFAGPVRISGGANGGIAPQAFLATTAGLAPFDPTDPLGLSLP